MRPLILFLFLVNALPLSAAEAPQAKTNSPKTSKDALRALNDLIGNWRAIGQLEAKKGFWTEHIEWAWQFRGDDTSLIVTFDKGKYFSRGELHWVPKSDNYDMVLETVNQETHRYTGSLSEEKLTLERLDPASGEKQRLAFSFFHDGRFVYQAEIQPKDKNSFNRIYQVGATKEGTPLAKDFVGPECLITGGQGTTKVSYAGKDYYVCCGGCRADFEKDPEKAVKEYLERLKKESQR